jgi:hypothetical protein
MAFTVGSLARNVTGNRRAHSGTLTFDSSYATGGESLVPSELGLHTIENIILHPSAGFSFDYDYAAQKVKVYVPAVVVGAAGAATLDDFPLTGTGATTARSVGLDNAAGSSTVLFGAQQEVAASTNLSSVVVRFSAIGT